MARTASTQLAANLWIKGDPVTGRRELSMKKLAAISGVTETHLRHVKSEDDWEGQARAYAEANQICPSWSAEGLVEKLQETRSVIGSKADQALSRVAECALDDKEFASRLEVWRKLHDHWSKLSGVDGLLEAEKVRQVELARLRAKSEAEAWKDEEESESEGGGKILEMEEA